MAKAPRQYGTQAPPKRIEPDMETPPVADQNIPYRGSVDHGMPIGVTHFNTELMQPDEPDDFTPKFSDEFEQGPLAVAVVSLPNDAQTRKTFATSRAYAVADGGNPMASGTVLAGRHAARTTLRIRNLGVAAINIAESPNLANAAFGYLLAAGGTVNLETADAVYASAVGSVDAPVCLIDEYTVVV